MVVSSAIDNPYLDEFLSINQTGRQWWMSGNREDNPLFKRDELVKKYAWAIPDQYAIDLICQYSPLIEIGAGTGYWSRLIHENGGDIICFDKSPHKNDWCDGKHHKVEYGTTRMARSHPERTLLLIWPPYATRMAYLSVANHYKAGGTRLIYVGEGYGGCTGDDRFHKFLSDKYDEVEKYSIPQWDGLYDRLYILERKA